MANNETDAKSSQILLCDGYNTDSDLVVQAYDVREDEWYPETIIADAKHRSVIPHNNKIYIIEVDADFSEDKYDLEIRTCDLLTNESETNKYPTAEYLGQPIGTHDHYIYFMHNLQRSISRFNLNDNTVEVRVATLNEGHDREGQCAFLDDKLYIFGVCYANYEESDCEVYDTETNEIKPIAPYPVETVNRKCRVISKYLTRSSEITGTAHDGKLYTMEEHTLRNMYVYCPGKNEWETITNEYPPGICKGRLVTCGGKLICMDRTMSIHLFDPETNSWESRTDYNGVMSSMTRVTAIEKSTIGL